MSVVNVYTLEARYIDIDTGDVIVGVSIKDDPITAEFDLTGTLLGENGQVFGVVEFIELTQQRTLIRVVDYAMVHMCDVGNSDALVLATLEKDKITSTSVVVS